MKLKIVKKVDAPPLRAVIPTAMGIRDAKKSLIRITVSLTEPSRGESDSKIKRVQITPSAASVCFINFSGRSEQRLIKSATPISRRKNAATEPPPSEITRSISVKSERTDMLSIRLSVSAVR